MQVKWEYKILSREALPHLSEAYLESRLNDFGAKGWELVSMGPKGSFVLKRVDLAWLKAEKRKVIDKSRRTLVREQPRSEIFTKADACCREDPEHRKVEVES